MAAPPAIALSRLARRRPCSTLISRVAGSGRQGASRGTQAPAGSAAALAAAAGGRRAAGRRRRRRCQEATLGSFPAGRHQATPPPCRAVVSIGCGAGSRDAACAAAAAASPAPPASRGARAGHGGGVSAGRGAGAAAAAAGGAGRLSGVDTILSAPCKLCLSALRMTLRALADAASGGSALLPNRCTQAYRLAHTGEHAG